jgi:hypothetical protein
LQEALLSYRKLRIAVLTTLALYTVVGVTWWFFQRPQLGAVQTAVDLDRFARHTISLAAIAGFTAMVIMDTSDRIFLLRGRFVLRRLPAQLRPKSPWPDRSRRAGLSSGGSLDDRPYGAGSGLTVYDADSPLEQVMARLGHLLEAALDELEAGPSSSQRKHGVRLLTEVLGPRPRAMLALEVLLANPPDAPRLDIRGRKRGDAASSGERVEAALTLRHEVQDALDALQMQIAVQWRRRLRIWTSALSAGVCLVTLLVVQAPPVVKLLVLASGLVVGGFFADLFRDLVALVSRSRTT